MSVQGDLLKCIEDILVFLQENLFVLQEKKIHFMLAMSVISATSDLSKKKLQNTVLYF